MSELISRLVRLYIVASVFLLAVVAAVIVLARFRDGVLALSALLVAAAVLRVVWMRTRW